MMMMMTMTTMVMMMIMTMMGTEEEKLSFRLIRPPLFGRRRL